MLKQQLEAAASKNDEEKATLEEAARLAAHKARDQERALWRDQMQQKEIEMAA